MDVVYNSETNDGSKTFSFGQQDKLNNLLERIVTLFKESDNSPTAGFQFDIRISDFSAEQIKHLKEDLVKHFVALENDSNGSQNNQPINALPKINLIPAMAESEFNTENQRDGSCPPQSEKSRMQTTENEMDEEGVRINNTESLVASEKESEVSLTISAFPCNSCRSIFKTSGQLNAHKVQHNHKLFKCKTCGRNFGRSTHLIAHERIHTGEKPFCCSTCGKSFRRASSLTRHKRVHSGEKPFQCNICEKRFNCSSNLAAHQLIHTRDEQFQCQTCKKYFKTSNYLAEHQRIHSGETPFRCSTCGQGFNRSSNLVAHERIHSGKKPFLCSICGRSFNRAAHLKGHQATHDRKKPSQCSS